MNSIFEKIGDYTEKNLSGKIFEEINKARYK